MIETIKIEGQVHGIFDADLPNQENRARVWQVKRIRVTGAMHAADFFGASIGVVTETTWEELKAHPGVYMKGSDLERPTKPGSWYDEIRLNMSVARRRRPD